MDASQYKDYVLVLLFIKYVSDKYAACIARPSLSRRLQLQGHGRPQGLDFSKNRAGGDDILGDAYEYRMRHFATESGKSKGQFYTPAEASRIMAQIIGIRESDKR
jgi:type I restriction enzyme M protein